MGTSVVAGTGACILFYGSIFAGPLAYALFRRYCLCHPVAMATLELFFVTIVALATKWFYSVSQHRLSRQASLALEDISLTQPDTPECASGEQRALWFDTLWRTQMERYGYLGRQPLRRRVDEPLENASIESVVPTILPLTRNAG